MTAVIAAQVDRPEAPPYVLEGHEGEVTSAVWCPTDFGQVSTRCGPHGCAEDTTADTRHQGGSLGIRNPESRQPASTH